MEREHELAEALLGDEQARREVTETLLEITSRAAVNAEGEVGVGLSVLVAGEVQSIGATSSPAQQLDGGQAADGEGPCLLALDSGDAVSVEDYTADRRWPRTSARAADAGIRSSLSLPLKSGDLVLGALNVYSTAAAAFSVEATLSLEAFAQQATTSLLMLGRLQAQRADSAYVTLFAHSVQDSLRTVLPQVVGVELFGESVPSAPLAAVGGDWYDAFVLRDGSLGLVIGDVMGHDVEAVTAMAQVRTMVRTAAWAGLDPAGVLHLTDELVHASGIEETVTLIYANLRRDDTALRLRYCNAGHPPPLLRDPDGTVRELHGGSRILLGAIGTGPRTESRAEDIGSVDLAPGALVVFYTDGLIERDGTEVGDAMTSLAFEVGAVDPGADLAAVSHHLLGEPSTTDDTTLLVLRIAT